MEVKDFEMQKLLILVQDCRLVIPDDIHSLFFLFRYCGGGLFTAATQPAQEQQLQPELLQGGLLHPENEALV